MSLNINLVHYTEIINNIITKIIIIILQITAAIYHGLFLSGSSSDYYCTFY